MRKTVALRRVALDSNQVYYTYDQHWTPDGNDVVADAVYRFLAESILAGERQSVTQ